MREHVFLLFRHMGTVDTPYLIGVFASLESAKTSAVGYTRTSLLDTAILTTLTWVDKHDGTFSYAIVNGTRASWEIRREPVKGR